MDKSASPRCIFFYDGIPLSLKSIPQSGLLRFHSKLLAYSVLTVKIGREASLPLSFYTARRHEKERESVGKALSWGGLLQSSIRRRGELGVIDLSQAGLGRV